MVNVNENTRSAGVSESSLTCFSITSRPYFVTSTSLVNRNAVLPSDISFTGLSYDWNESSPIFTFCALTVSVVPLT